MEAFFYDESLRGGSSLVRRDRVHITLNTYSAQRDERSQREYMQYLAGHELAHVIAKARRRAVYVDLEALGRPSSISARDYVSQLASVVEHPTVHAIMRDYGLEAGNEQSDSIRRLLNGPVSHFVGMEQQLGEYGILSVALDLVGFMTAFRTDDSEAMLSRISEVALDFTKRIRAASREIERLGVDVFDVEAVAGNVADILGHDRAPGRGV